jgi:hypothetical protein
MTSQRIRRAVFRLIADLQTLTGAPEQAQG